MLLSETTFLKKILTLADEIRDADDNFTIDVAINEARTIYRDQFENLLGINEKYVELKNKKIDEIAEWYAKHLNKKVLEFDEYDMHIAKCIKQYLDDYGKD